MQLFLSQLNISNATNRREVIQDQMASRLQAEHFERSTQPLGSDPLTPMRILNKRRLGEGSKI